MGKTNTKDMSAIQRTTLKTNKIRPGRLSNGAFRQDRANNLSWRSPGSVLEGSGSLRGSTWLAFGLSWAALGPSWKLLGRLLDVSWALLGACWLLRAPRASILGGLGGCRAGFWRASGARFGMLFAAPRVHDIMLLLMQ